VKAFSNRYEIKYALDLAGYSRVKRALGRILEPDPHPEYYVQSIYFDSRRYLFYGEKREGILQRTKPRIRIYRRRIDGEALKVFLEFKSRRDRTIHKEREELRPEMAERLLQGGGSDSGPILGRLHYMRAKYDLVPAVNVLYHREAYYLKSTGLL
jgi:hypothetical protein